jgi:multicomponent Na+:H+ antiporter subunit E
MKSPFTLNILFTLVWVALTGKTEFSNFVFGFIITFFILYLISDNTKSEGGYFSRVPNVIVFIGYFLLELIKANIQVAFDVVTPKNYMKPGIVAIPLDAKTDLEITLLANVITLTPGTLSLDVSTDKKTLYVHAMYINDPQEFIDEIKNGFEKKLLNILR